MKKTVYIPIMQYTSSRHKTFLEQLCEYCTVIVPRVSLVALRSQNIEWVEDILAEEIPVSEDNSLFEADIRIDAFDTEYKRLCDFVKECMTSIVASEYSMDAVRKETDIYMSGFQTIYKEAVQLVQVSKRRKIDFVIASCDYAYLSRPAIHMAKLLGIHTVDVEHGYFGMRLHPSAWQPPAKMQRAVSDTIIVDNELEAKLFEEYRMPYSTQQYIPLGTPMEHAYKGTHLTRNDALDALQLNHGYQTIVLALSWSIPYSLDGLLATHRYEVAFVESVLSVLSNNEKYNKVQVIVKLHPAVKNFHEDRHVIRFYKSLAKRYQLADRAAVTVTAFDNVLPCADSVIGWTMSSVLFDTAMEGVPAAYYVTTKNQKMFKEDPNLHSEMAKAGLIRILLSPSDLEEYLDIVLAETYRELYGKHRDDFVHKWRINRQTVRQKSLNIVNWLQNFSLQK